MYLSKVTVSYIYQIFASSCCLSTPSRAQLKSRAATFSSTLNAIPEIISRNRRTILALKVGFSPRLKTTAPFHAAQNTNQETHSSIFEKHLLSNISPTTDLPSSAKPCIVSKAYSDSAYMFAFTRSRVHCSRSDWRLEQLRGRCLHAPNRWKTVLSWQGPLSFHYLLCPTLQNKFASTRTCSPHASFSYFTSLSLCLWPQMTTHHVTQS